MAILWELYGKGLGDAAASAEKAFATRRMAQALGGVDLSTPDGALQASKALIGMGRTQEGMTLAQLAMQERNRREELGLRRDDLGLRRQSEERQGAYQQQSLGLQRETQQATNEVRRGQLDLQRQQALRKEVPAGFELTEGGGLRPIPGGPADPTYKRESEKTKDPFEKVNIDRIGELRTAADKGRELLGNISALEAARKAAYTGGMMRVPGASTAAGVINPANQQLDAMASTWTLGAAESMKGALSDKDIAFLKSGTPGAQMSDEAAKPIFDVARAGALRSRERSKFYETWYSRNKTLEGADDAWDKFLTEKPVVTYGKKGEPIINQNNVAAWKGYVAEKPASAPRGAAPASAPAQSASVIGPAPAGSVEGRTGTLPDGRKVIVRNGQVELAQ